MTKRLNFAITINAPKEKVWTALWEDANYRTWTSAFSEGSYAKSDWKEGSKIQFLSPSGEGMYSNIARKIPNEYMSFKHIGVMKEGKEQPMDDETRKWSGAEENYTLEEDNGTTQLSVEIDITEDFEEYFKTKFPLALEKVKAIAEG